MGPLLQGSTSSPKMELPHFPKKPWLSLFTLKTELPRFHLKRSFHISHFHVDGFDLSVIVQCVRAVFPTQPGFLVPPKGDPHRVNIVVVDVQRAHLQCWGYPVGPLEITERKTGRIFREILLKENRVQI